MFKLQSRVLIGASLATLFVCASLLVLAPRSATAADRVGPKPLKNGLGFKSAPEGLYVQHIFLGKIVYGKSRVVYSAKDLEKLIFRWATNEPGITGGCCFASRKPQIVFGNLLGAKKFILDPNGHSALFTMNLAQFTDKLPPGDYYFGVYPLDADGHIVNDLSNVVKVTCKAP